MFEGHVIAFILPCFLSAQEPRAFAGSYEPARRSSGGGTLPGLLFNFFTAIATFFARAFIFYGLGEDEMEAGSGRKRKKKYLQSVDKNRRIGEGQR
jgi:hypothetical protein